MILVILAVKIRAPPGTYYSLVNLYLSSAILTFATLLDHNFVQATHFAMFSSLVLLCKAFCHSTKRFDITVTP
jgi:hypothetical protein